MTLMQYELNFAVEFSIIKETALVAKFVTNYIRG
jgi:hypothetical protein